MTRRFRSRGLSAEAKARLARHVDNTARAWEPAFVREAGKQFRNDLKELLAAVRNQVKARGTDVLPEAIRRVLEKAGARWRAAFIPIIQAEITEHGKTLAAAFGFSFDVSSLYAREWWSDYTLVFAQNIMDSTKDDVNTLIGQALAEGWTNAQIEERLELLFRQYEKGDLTPEEFEWFEDRMPRYRLETISRTETARAQNAGSDALYREWGCEAREWLATHDLRVRETHLEAERRYSEGGDPGPLPMDEPFMIGPPGQESPMMYPGDPAGPIEEVANCRCTTIPVIRV